MLGGVFGFFLLLLFFILILSHHGEQWRCKEKQTKEGHINKPNVNPGPDPRGGLSEQKSPEYSGRKCQAKLSHFLF